MALVRAGLWEKDVQLTSFGDINFKEIYRLAIDQSIVGLVAAGIEYVNNIKKTLNIVFPFAGLTIKIMNRNKLMNAVLCDLLKKLRSQDIYSIIICMRRVLRTDTVLCELSWKISRSG